LRGDQQPAELRPLADRLAELFSRLRAQRAALRVDEQALRVVNPDLEALGYTRAR
jgi:hypothetical protein